MEREVALITEYLDSISSPYSLTEPVKDTPKEYVETKVPLEMKVLQQRIDSINIVKYYRDLKAERIKTLENERFVGDEDELFDEMMNAEKRRPWPKLSAINRRNKILDFVSRLNIDNRDEVRAILLKMLDDKKIKKSNIELDNDFNILRLGDYSLDSN